MSEKMRVLDLLENGKITAEEAARLLESLGSKSSQVEDKLHRFAADVNKFAKEVGEKVQVMYKNVEPKIKKAGHTALEKAATALDELAHTIHEALEKADKESCCDGEPCDCDEPREN